MARIEPLLISTLSDLARGLRELNVGFCVLGALVPELLLDTPPERMTNDADAMVVVESLTDFERLKDRLAAFGFGRTALPYRMQHRGGGWVDLLPFSKTIAPDGRLKLSEDLVFNMVGFDQLVAAAIQTPIASDLMIPLPPLPLYVLLKLVAFSDRKAPKDLGSVFHCLEHYQEDGERRYGIDHDGKPVPFEYTCAYLVGLDGREFLPPLLGDAVRSVLTRFDSPNGSVVGIVAHEKRRLFVEDADRAEIFETFRWFRLGSGV